uniref:G protein-coupled receptor n=1 Tax=Haemonchus contortus TaxID=6289 RepID=A0A7I4YZ92_HAECO
MDHEVQVKQHAEFLEHLFNSIMIGVYSIAILYTICNILAVIYLSLRVQDSEDIEAYMIIDKTYQGVYIYLTCTVIFCVMERFLATVFSKTYEFRRNWFILLVGQIAVREALQLFPYRLIILGGTISDMVQLGLSFVILTCLVILLVVNRRLGLLTRGRESLSSRYQISENVRALRLVAPAVLLDTSVTIADMIGALFFDVRPAFYRESYESGSSRYLVAYIVLRGAAVILQYGIPVAIVSHETLRKVACGSLSKVTGKPSCAQNDEVGEIEARRESHQAVYFNYIRDQWA